MQHQEVSNLQGSQFRPNSELKSHIMGGGMMNAVSGGAQAQVKSLQTQASLKSQHSSKDRLKQIMELGGVASDDDLAKIKRGTKKK